MKKKLSLSKVSDEQIVENLRFWYLSATKAEIEKEKLLAKSKEKLKKLKRKFTYKKDEFQDIGFYTHKRWGEYWPNRKH